MSEREAILEKRVLELERTFHTFMVEFAKAIAESYPDNPKILELSIAARKAVRDEPTWAPLHRESPSVAPTSNGVLDAAEKHADKKWARKVGSYPNPEWVRDFESFVKGADFVITGMPKQDAAPVTLSVSRKDKA